MQRFINNPDEVVEDTVKGFVKAHADIVRLGSNPRVIAARHAPVAGKVGVITGGGSGHEPAFIGYTGRNMLDAVAVGELFSSPTAKSFLDAAREADGGKGVVCLYGNYAGDNMNVKMAIKLAAKEGITIETVVANDDVCSAGRDEREKRRGVAGEIFMWKCAGAKAGEELASRRCRRSRSGRSTIAAPSASALVPAPYRPSGIRTSRSSLGRWRSASATMASRACGWSR